MTTSRWRQAQAADAARAFLVVVLDAFLGAEHRLLSAGHDRLHERCGGVPKVGGISEASTTPSRPLVPAPMKMTRPPLRRAWRDDLDAVRDALFLLLNRGDDLAVLVDHHLDDVARPASCR